MRVAFATTAHRNFRGNQGTTGNSPQTNHIKNITSLFPCAEKFSSVCGWSAGAHRPRRARDSPRAPDRETP
jgi:hypothetical protein